MSLELRDGRTLGFVAAKCAAHRVEGSGRGAGLLTAQWLRRKAWLMPRTSGSVLKEPIDAVIALLWYKDGSRHTSNIPASESDLSRGQVVGSRGRGVNKVVLLREWSALVSLEALRWHFVVRVVGNAAATLLEAKFTSCGRLRVERQACAHHRRFSSAGTLCFLIISVASQAVCLLLLATT